MSVIVSSCWKFSSCFFLYVFIYLLIDWLIDLLIDLHVIWGVIYLNGVDKWLLINITSQVILAVPITSQVILAVPHS